MTVCAPGWLIAVVALAIAGPSTARAWWRLNGEGKG